MDERLMMTCPLRHEAVSRMDFGGDGPDVGQLDNDRPYYYTLDRCILDTRQTLCVSWPQGRPGRPSRRRESRMRFLVDRAGALVERYCYESSGKPLTCPLRREVVSRVRESCGRGDFNHDTELTSDDRNRLTSAYTSGGSIWDPRGDLDDDGDVDDLDLYDVKDDLWAPGPPSPVVAQAFSDVGNPYMFQGVPHFALDTATSATSPTLPLNQHRARFNDSVTGRWTTRDPVGYWDSMNLYECLLSKPTGYTDPSGLGDPGFLMRYQREIERMAWDQGAWDPYPEWTKILKIRREVELCIKRNLQRIERLRKTIAALKQMRRKVIWIGVTAAGGEILALGRAAVWGIRVVIGVLDNPQEAH